MAAEPPISPEAKPEKEATPEKAMIGVAGRRAAEFAQRLAGAASTAQEGAAKGTSARDAAKQAAEDASQVADAAQATHAPDVAAKAKGIRDQVAGKAEQAALQRQGDGPKPDVDPSHLHASLLRQGGPGSPPDARVRQAVGPHLEIDPAAARVHTDPAAAEAARGLHAQAFTIGRDVFFGANTYDPSSAKGIGLISHELTHVAQQGGAMGDKPRLFTQGGGDQMEQEAEQTRVSVQANLGRLQGVTVATYEREYECADGGPGLTDEDRTRLDRISIDALRKAEQTMEAESTPYGGQLGDVEVSIDLDLGELSDAEASELWAQAICDVLRERAKQPAGMPVVPKPMAVQGWFWSPDAGAKTNALPQKERETKQDDLLKQIKEKTDLWYVSFIVEYQLQSLWRELGDLWGLFERKPEAADLWIRGVDKGVDISEVPQANTLQDTFKDDVTSVALDYLALNEKNAREEMGRLGLYDEHAARPFVPLDQTVITARIKALQEVATRVKTIVAKQKELRAIPVGQESYVWGKGEFQEIRYRASYFSPQGPPQLPATGKEDPPMMTWDSVNIQWQQTEAGIATAGRDHPLIYAAIRDDTIATIADGTPEQARAAIGKTMLALMDNIWKSQDKIREESVDYREFLPIHAQLFGGHVKSNTLILTDWQREFPKAVGKSIVQDYQSAEFWKSLGLASLAAALFVVAEIASGGLATFALVGGAAISVGSAAASIKHYYDISELEGTSVSAETSIVQRDQVTAAKLDAIISTVGAFLDVAGPALKFGKAARLAYIEKAAGTVAAKSALEGLGKIATMSAEDLAKTETKQMVEKAVREIGVKETLQKAGLRADDYERLANIVGKDTEAGKRILAAGVSIEKLGEKELRDQLKNLRSLASIEEAEKVAAQALDRLGPQETLRLGGGWDAMAEKLTNQSAVGKRLMAWRDGVYADLETYIGKDNIKRTGRNIQFSNDMDMSLLGKDAAANETKARNFLAGRAGLSPDEVDKMLSAGFFTDPRRMHLYATLPPELSSKLATRRVAFEQELIWSKRIAEAEEPLKSRLVEQAKRLNIQVKPYKEFSAKDLSFLDKEVDDLHNQLEAAQRAGDLKKQGELIDKIAENQAQINAARGGGYFSGGGTQKWVTERDMFPGYTPEEVAKMTPQQKLGNVMDQLAKLDHASTDLEKIAKAGVAEAGSGDVVKALKSVGKYGDRLTTGIKDALGQDVKLANFEAISESFRTLKADVESGAIAAKVASGQAEDVALQIERIQRALTDLDAASDSLIVSMQKRASVVGVKGDFGAIQSATRSHIALTQMTNGVREQVASFSLKALNAAQKTAPPPPPPPPPPK